MRVAALDCGTNSLRLLIADVEDGSVRDLTRQMRIVRLGEGVDRTGRFAPAALERTLTVLGEYAAQIEAAGAQRVRMVATSASRDAANREEFLRGAERVLGVAPEVVSGETEAALSFAGATAGLDRRRHRPPYLVVDIGGGSTEFVLGSERVEAACSVDIGCVRMTERHLPDDPPTAAQVAAAAADIDAAVARAGQVVELARAATLVGLAGSVTTVAALALDLPGYDPARIHLAAVSAADVAAVAARLLGMTRAQRAALAVMHPGRVDVIGAGALVLDRVLRRTGHAEVIASEHDILDGIALAAAGYASPGQPSPAG